MHFASTNTCYSDATVEMVSSRVSENEGEAVSICAGVTGVLLSDIAVEFTVEHDSAGLSSLMLEHLNNQLYHHNYK